MTIYNWSTTAATNASADSSINWAENQAPSTVNDSARALMARVAAWIDTLGGSLTYGGSGNAYTATSPSGHALSAYATGVIYMLAANHTNSGAATINVDGLGAKNIKTADSGDVISGDLVSGGRYLLCYDGTNFQVLNTIGGGAYQPLDATLTAWGALSGSANQLAYWTGTDTFALSSLTAFGRSLIDDVDAAAARTTLGLSSAATATATAFGLSLLDDADAAAGRTTLGLVIGTDVQAYDADLANIAALSTTSFGRSFLTQADAAAARSYIGVGLGTGDVVGPASATDNALVLFDGTTGRLVKNSTYTITAFGASLIDDADAAAARTTLGLVIGTNVQAYDADLAAIAGLTSAADKLPYFTGSATAAVTDISSFGRSLIDDADAAAARTTLGLGTAATVNTGTSGATIPLLNGANTWSAAQTFSVSPIFSLSTFNYALIRDTASTSGQTGVQFQARDLGGTQRNGYLYIAGSALYMQVPPSGTFAVVAESGSPTLSVNGNAVWHAGNDGAGSTLDADTVDGAHVGTSGATIPLLNGANTFSAAQVFSVGASINAGTPYLDFIETDASANNKWWRLVVAGEQLAFGVLNDAASQANWLTIDRTGTTIDVITFPIGNVDIAGTLLAPLRSATGVSGTLTRASHANRTVNITGGITIDNSVFSAGDLIAGYCDSGSNQTITQGSGVTMRLGGTATTGNRTAIARGRFEVYFVSASECVVSGSVT